MTSEFISEQESEVGVGESQSPGFGQVAEGR